MKKSSSNNNNITIPQKYCQTAALFENTSVVATMEKNFAVFNLIDEGLMVNSSCIILSTCIFDMAIGNNSQMVNSDLDNNSLRDLHKSEIVSKCKNNMCLLFLFLIKSMNR